MKLYDNLDANFELDTEEKEANLIFFIVFSTECDNIFVYQQDRYFKMSIVDIVKLFQVCHTTDAPLCKQHKCEAMKKHDCKEVKREKDSPKKKGMVHHKNSLSHDSCQKRTA